MLYKENFKIVILFLFSGFLFCSDIPSRAPVSLSYFHDLEIYVKNRSDEVSRTWNCHLEDSEKLYEYFCNLRDKRLLGNSALDVRELSDFLNLDDDVVCQVMRKEDSKTSMSQIFSNISIFYKKLLFIKKPIYLSNIKKRDKNFIIIIEKTSKLMDKKQKLDKETLDQLKLLAEKDAELQVVLAKVYHSGLGEFESESDETYKEEVKYLNLALENGSKEALSILGVCYVHGYGVPQDKTRALALFEEAVLSGDEQAKRFMLILKAGMNQETNEKLDKETLDQLKLLAEKDAKLQIVLAGIYHNGLGEFDAESDDTYKEEVKYLNQARIRGAKEAAVHLGISYVKGKGVSKNILLAQQYFQEAVLSGDEQAKRFRLILKAGMNQEKNEKLDKETLNQLKLLAEEDAELQMVLAGVYHNGLGEFDAESDDTYKEEVKWLNKAKVNGAKEAAVHLGISYLKGKGVSKNILLAQKYFQEAVLSGDEQAKRFMLILKAGMNQEKDEKLDKETLDQLKLLAEKDAELQMVLAGVYHNGLGEFDAESDDTYKEEVKYLNQARIRGAKEAAVHLGISYVKGKGVSKNILLAQQYFQEAVLSGDEQAKRFRLILKAGMNQEKNEKLDKETLNQLKLLAEEDAELQMVLAGVYHNGLGEFDAESDDTYKEEVKWLNKAKINGAKEAAVHLGISYLKGKGVSKNILLAQKYFQEAVLNGDEKAKRFILILKAGMNQEKNEKLDKETLDQLKLLAEKDAELQMVLAGVYHNGLGEFDAESDDTYKEEVKWLNKARIRGAKEAAVHLGISYLKGKGVSKNILLAQKYFQEAVLNGDEKAKRFILILKAGMNQEKNEKLDKETLDQLKLLAEKDAELQMVLAGVYHNGLGEFDAKSDDTYKEEFKYLNQAKINGAKEAAVHLGISYLKGKGVSKNILLAQKYFQEAVLNGDEKAKRFILILKAGMNQEKNEKLDKETLDQLKLLAEKDAELQMVLAGVYHNGLGEFDAKSGDTYKEEVKWLNKARIRGAKEALRLLGVCYVHGYGVPQDKIRALALFEKAALGGDHQAKRFMLILKAGMNQEKNEKLDKETLDQLKLIAEKDAELQMVLAGVYHNGLGEFDAESNETYKEEVKYLNLALENGLKEALSILGVCYVHGYGVPQDKIRALELFEEAAQKGDEQAKRFMLILKAGMNQEKNKKLDKETLDQLKLFAEKDAELQMVLAKVYHSGLGEFESESDETYKEEVKYLNLALENGSKEALSILGVCYVHGYGVPQDKIRALELFEEAAQKGDKQAKRFTLILKAGMNQEKNEKLDKETLDQLRLLAEKDVELQVVLAKVYHSGLGEFDAESDDTYKEGIKYLNLAAEKGCKESLIHLGFCYVHGYGVPQDKIRALEFFEEAAQKGDEQARKFTLALKTVIKQQKDEKVNTIELEQLKQDTMNDHNIYMILAKVYASGIGEFDVNSKGIQRFTLNLGTKPGLLSIQHHKNCTFNFQRIQLKH
ncbi:MAG: hypothetical protein FADNKDHG_01424 [Holosporales bacterium]